jgi:hypothetical protein
MTGCGRIRPGTPHAKLLLLLLVVVLVVVLRGLHA